jgi:hypothetical protein
MKYKLDITTKKFDCVDFSEARLFFPCPRKLPETLIFEAWGVTLLTAPHWEKTRCDLPDFLLPTKDDDTYISGISTVVIEGVVGGELQVAIYQPNPPHHLIQAGNGELVRLRRSWEGEKPQGTMLYQMHSALDWPYGDCSLVIAANGKATLEFETEDCVSALAYVKETDRYGFQQRRNS